MTKSFRHNKSKPDYRLRVNSSALAYDIASDLSVALGVAPPASAQEWISRPVPDVDTSSDVFRNTYLVSEILSKYDSHNLGIDTESAALSKFWEAEEICRATNVSFRTTSSVDITFGYTRASIIHMAREKIRRVLGTFKWSEVVSRAHFSSGASIGLRRKEGSPMFKYERPAECSDDVAPLVDIFVKGSVLLDYTFEKKRCNFNKATTVPKNSKTDRMIAIEPSWNMFFQLGLGACIRKKLKRIGIDLNDQSVNQRLAYSGSVDGSLATIDLSMASDTISQMVVYELLPPDWLSALDLLRSKWGYVKDKLYTYQKFSSMGNGFTFELETLIFWSLASVCCDICNLDNPTLSVYGDDIIIPSAAADCLYDILNGFGFIPNVKKSYHTGPFRESCGKHYHNGVDVTPFYIRSEIRTVPDLILVLNNLYRWGSIDGVMDPRVLSVYRKYVKLLPKFWRINTVPDGYGDSALVGSLVTNTYKRAVPKSGYTFRVRGLRLKNRKAARPELGAYAVALNSLFPSDDVQCRSICTGVIEEFTFLVGGTVSANYGFGKA